ncbi:MAG: hypothetical protein JSV46_02355 [Candidatus Aminicenantes bacterium]|nr:MAG: hypothetical protein JSV46_02355 [Candidatus Aminicenantes bacterium]
MKETFLTARVNTLLSTVLGILTAIFVIAVLTGWKVPVVSGEKEHFIILAVFGAVLCVAGNSHSATMFGWTNSLYWTNAFSIIGMVLGFGAASLIVLTLLGINIPLIAGYKTAFIVLTGIIFLKVGLKILQNLKLKITE